MPKLFTILMTLFLMLILSFLALSDKSCFYAESKITPHSLVKQGFILLKDPAQINHYNHIVDDLKKETGLDFTKIEIYKSSPTSYAYILAYFQDENKTSFIYEIA